MSNDKRIRPELDDKKLSRTWKLWTKICMMIMDGKRDAGEVADCLQNIVDGSKSAVAESTKFKLINTFSIVVPQGYDHATRLDSFRKEHHKEFYSYNDAITDKNYAKATTKLESGRKFKVKVFQIKERVTSLDCMAHLRSQKAILVGAQGASLVCEQKKEELPVDRWSVSFDEKDALWEDGGGLHRVPRVYRHSGGDFEFHLGHFVSDWHDVYCLLCFCDESSDA